MLLKIQTSFYAIDQLLILLNIKHIDTLHEILFDLLKIILLLISIAYYTLAERKIMAAAQRRLGPNVVGLFGLLQPLADGLKLLSKELLIPTSASTKIFLFAPVLILVLSLISWIVIPMGINDTVGNLNQFEVFPLWCLRSFWSVFELGYIELEPVLDIPPLTELQFIKVYYEFYTTILPIKTNVANINYSILYILAISSLNVYGIIIAGWASNSKYAFLGSLRSAAQMISYEVSIGLIILPIILLSGTLNFTKIVMCQENTIWFLLPLLPCAIIFFISMLAETNRTPFDLTEAEAELVAGYNTEYSSIIFAMFFLGEYSNMLLMSALFTILFMGGWSIPVFSGLFPHYIVFSFKTVVICFFFVITRATLPRYRYDQLMDIGWKIFLPISLAYLFFVTGLLLACNAIPVSYEVIFN